MKKILALLAVAGVLTLASCEKANNDLDDIPRTNVPGNLQGLWMYGNFSTTEYWTEDPATYIGNGYEIGMAFDFNSDGTYTQYFTSRTVLGGISTYQRSVSTGTVEVDEAAHTIKTHPTAAHYKRTRYNQTLEERDLEQSELSADNVYTYTTGTEPSGTKAVYLKLGTTANPLPFLQIQ